MIKYLLVIIVILTPCIAWGDPPKNFIYRSPAAVEFGFDFMETFDDLQDWKPTYVNEHGPDTIVDPSHPKRLDGSNTLLNVNEYWSSNGIGPDYFITDPTVDNVPIWRGTGKAAKIAAEGELVSTPYAPGFDHLGVTFSETGTDIAANATVGYKGIFIFSS